MDPSVPPNERLVEEGTSVKGSPGGVYQLPNGALVPSGIPSEMASLKGLTDRLSNTWETFLENGSAAHVELISPIGGMGGRGGTKRVGCEVDTKAFWCIGCDCPP